MKHYNIFRSSVNEVDINSSGDDKNGSRNASRFKPKPPPRNPNTTKTSHSYLISNGILSSKNHYHQKPINYAIQRSVAPTSMLHHVQSVKGSERLLYVTDKERMRDVGAEDADVSSQSSSSGVNIRNGARLPSNLGKVII